MGTGKALGAKGWGVRRREWGARSYPQMRPLGPQKDETVIMLICPRVVFWTSAESKARMSSKLCEPGWLRCDLTELVDRTAPNIYPDPLFPGLP